MKKMKCCELGPRSPIHNTSYRKTLQSYDLREKVAKLVVFVMQALVERIRVIRVRVHSQVIFSVVGHLQQHGAGNTKGVSITVLLTYCLTGLKSAV
jgi:hypothetical protein